MRPIPPLLSKYRIVKNMKVFTIEKRIEVEEKSSLLPFRNWFFDLLFSYTYSYYQHLPLKYNNEFNGKLSDSIVIYKKLEEPKYYYL